MCYEININGDHNGHSFQLRQKNFTVEWFSMLGHELIEQPSYHQNYVRAQTGFDAHVFSQVSGNGEILRGLSQNKKDSDLTRNLVIDHEVLLIF